MRFLFTFALSCLAFSLAAQDFEEFSELSGSPAYRASFTSIATEEGLIYGINDATASTMVFYKINAEGEITATMSLDSTCCMGLVILGMIVAVFALSVWSNRQQQRAEEMAQGPYQYGQTPGGQQGTQGGVYYSSGGGQATRPGDATSRITYGATELDVMSADRLMAPDQRPTSVRERYEATDLTCPRCRGHDIIGFSDGSAKCKSCKKIFFPRRR